jgi:hypothetical protein
LILVLEHFKNHLPYRQALNAKYRANKKEGSSYLKQINSKNTKYCRNTINLETFILEVDKLEENLLSEYG